MPDFSQVILLDFLHALPWLVGAVVVAGVLGWSPLGRSFRRRSGNDDAAMREVHGEMAAIRQELAEVQERLDYSERLLASAQYEPIRNPPPPRSVTPV